MLRVGVTGGIGSGKSTVGRMLCACGAALIDADAISRQLTASGGLAIDAVRQQFGAHSIATDGAMNRDFMRQLVFSQKSARRQLEAIVHPLVAQETQRQMAVAAAAGSRCLVVDHPLLVESGLWRWQLDYVLVVDCSEDTQINRVLVRETGRGQWTREMVQKVIAGQASRALKLAAADICIYNDDGLTLDKLDAIVERLAIRFGL